MNIDSIFQQSDIELAVEVTGIAYSKENPNRMVGCFVWPFKDTYSDPDQCLYIKNLSSQLNDISKGSQILVKINLFQLTQLILKKPFKKNNNKKTQENLCEFKSVLSESEFKNYINKNINFLSLFEKSKNLQLTLDTCKECKNASIGTSFFKQLNFKSIDDQLKSIINQNILDLEEKIKGLKNDEIKISEKLKLKVDEFSQFDENFSILKTEYQKLQDSNLQITESNESLKKEAKKLTSNINRLKKESIEFKDFKDFYDQNLWLNPLKSVYEKSISNSENLHQKTEQLTDKFFKKISNQLGFKQISEDFIHTYLLSLFTSLVNGRFLLLTGHIGTGKSSLIKDTGPLLGGDTTLIPVRPGWIDSSDLLGFYDPIKDKFRATEFTTAIQQPNNDQINIILLDEMNIARIENYAADILSCHNPIGERKNLNLYQNDLGTEQHIQLAKTLENLNLDQSIREIIFKQLQPNSNHEITLNDNLLLCGTLNIDGSTENLPPKMIDRSFMLKFPDFDGSLSILKQKLETMPVSIQSIVDIYNEPVSDAEIQQWKQFNSDWISPFHDILLPISHRVATDYILFQRFAKKLKLLKHIDIYFIYSRVLPRLQFTHNPDLYKKANDFINKLSPISGQKSVLSALKSYEDKDGFEVSYQHLCG